MNDASKFVRKLDEDPEFRKDCYETLKEEGKQTREEKAEVMVRFAKNKGYEFTAEELSFATAQRRKEAIEEGELEEVAAGTCLMDHSCGVGFNTCVISNECRASGNTCRSSVEVCRSAHRVCAADHDCHVAWNTCAASNECAGLESCTTDMSSCINMEKM